MNIILNHHRFCVILSNRQAKWIWTLVFQLNIMYVFLPVSRNERSFICNYKEHWFTVRKLGKQVMLPLFPCLFPHSVAHLQLKCKGFVPSSLRRLSLSLQLQMKLTSNVCMWPGFNREREDISKILYLIRQYSRGYF